MPAPGPVLIQYIMSKLLLAAAPIETLIKAIKGSSWGGARGWEDVVNSGCIGTGGIESEQGSRKGEQGRGSYVAIGGGEHTVLCSRFHSPLCITSSLHVFPSLPLGALVPPQRWLFRLGLAWLWVIYSSAAVWGQCGDQLLHISMGG